MGIRCTLIVWNTFKEQSNNDTKALPGKVNTTAFNQPLTVSVNLPCKHFMKKKKKKNSRMVCWKS